MKHVVPSVGVSYASCILIHAARAVFVECAVYVDEGLCGYASVPSSQHAHGLSLQADIHTRIVVGGEVAVEHIGRAHTYHRGVDCLSMDKRRRQTEGGVALGRRLSYGEAEAERCGYAHRQGSTHYYIINVERHKKRTARRWNKIPSKLIYRTYL